MGEAEYGVKERTVSTQQSPNDGNILLVATKTTYQGNIIQVPKNILFIVGIAQEKIYKGGSG